MEKIWRKKEDIYGEGESILIFGVDVSSNN
jgi:hypothetical protein